MPLVFGGSNFLLLLHFLELLCGLVVFDTINLVGVSKVDNFHQSISRLVVGNIFGRDNG